MAEKKLLPTTTSHPVEQLNRAKMRRLPVDMPSSDLRAFGDQARDKGMTMRRYMYFLWDQYTKDNRALSVFDE